MPCLSERNARRLRQGAIPRLRPRRDGRRPAMRSINVAWPRPIASNTGRDSATSETSNTWIAPARLRARRGAPPPGQTRFHRRTATTGDSRPDRSSERRGPKNWQVSPSPRPLAHRLPGPSPCAKVSIRVLPLPASHAHRRVGPRGQARAHRYLDASASRPGDVPERFAFQVDQPKVRRERLDCGRRAQNASAIAATSA